jgi:hypothetical protein
MGLLGLAAEEALTLPQTLLGLESGLLSSAKPYLDLTKDTFALGRATNISGESLRGQLFPGAAGVADWQAGGRNGTLNLDTPDWMAGTGAGPLDYSRYVKQYGVVPFRNEGNSIGIASAFAGSKYLPGFSMMSENDVTGSLSFAAKAGLTGAGGENEVAGMQRYAAQLSAVLENATARGVDKATVLHSIDSSIMSVAQRGAGYIDVAGMQKLSMQFSNMPGGALGVEAGRAISGVDAATQSLGTDPMRSLVGANVLQRVQSEGDLAKLIGGPAKLAEFKAKDPHNAEAVDMLLLSNKKGDIPASFFWWKAISKSFSQAQFNLFNQPGYVGMFPKEQQLPALAHQAGLGDDPFGAMNFRDQGSGGPLVNTGMGDARSLENYGPGVLSGFRPDKIDNYRAALARMGVRNDLGHKVIDEILAESQRKNINPLGPGALSMLESSGGWDAHLDTGKGAFGIPGTVNVMGNASTGEVVLPDGRRIPMAKPTSIHESVVQGINEWADDINRYGSQGIYRALQGYNGRGMKPEYANKFGTYLEMAGAGGNIPEDVLRRQAEIKQQEQAGAAITWGELNTVVAPALNASFGALVAGANGAAAALRGITRALGGNDGTPERPN